MFKKANVVMLATNQKATVNSIVHRNSDNRIAMVNILTVDDPNKHLHTTQHLYITSDEEIKEGQILPYLMKWENKYELFNSNNGISYSRLNRANRIIASTNTSLNLPQPSPQFIQKYIEEYNKGNVITEVMVEYILEHDLKTLDKTKEFNEIPKVNSKDNTITIKKIKDSWTREEVVKLIKEYHASFASYPTMNLNLRDNWINKKL